MRPEKDRSISRHQAVARGRMMIKAHMDWLPGFPAGWAGDIVEWVVIPRHGTQPPERVQLGRDHIREATYTFNKLVRRFPRALPYVVDDRKNWVERVPLLLDRLKGTIHHDVRLPESLFHIDDAFPRKVVQKGERVIKNHPELAPLVHALSWVTYLTPSDAFEAVDWAESNAQVLYTLLEVCPGTEGIMLGTMFRELTRRDEPRRMEPLLHLIGDRQVHTTPMSGGTEVIRYWKTAVQQSKSDPFVLPIPDPQAGRTLLDFGVWLMQQDQGTRRRALTLFALLIPANLPQFWAAWWDRIELLQKRVRRLVALPKKERREAERLDILQQLEEAEETRPPLLHIDRLLGYVRVASQKPRQKLHRQICLTLPTLPYESKAGLVRVAFLDHWIYLSLWHRTRLVHWLRTFRSYLKHDINTSRLLNPWRDVVRNWNQPSPHSTWGITGHALEELSPQRLQAVALDALAVCCKRKGQKKVRRDAERLVELVQLTQDKDQAAAWFQALFETDLKDTYLPYEVLKCSHVLVQPPEERAVVAGRLLKAHREDDNICDLIMLVQTELAGCGRQGLAGRCILDGQIKSLRTAGEWLRVLKALKGRIAPPRPIPNPTVPNWAVRYGPVFEVVLARLAACSPEAESIAKRMLGKYFPDPEDLKREIAVLEERLTMQADADAMRRRLINLQRRLEHPVPIKPARQARLIRKLKRAVDRITLETWSDALQNRVRRKLSMLIGVDPLPDWFYERRVLQILAPMLDLSGAFKNLGLRLLRLRCGPPPWNLPDDPANQVFIDRMTREGIRMQPWLEPPNTQVVTGENGRRVHLSFESDPLEIFHMGTHFKTCLRPGAFNFFSVFANAADINKHVVYARNEQGQVIGRCLLALSDQGGVLIFEPYCHDPKLGFDTIMSHVATRLAERMQTVVVRAGTVSCLVAPDWYDDGPRDLGHRFEFLEEGSEFLQSLAGMDPDALVPTLKSLFDPLPLNSLTLTLVLKLKEFEERPELIKPLFPILKACKGFTGPVWIDIAWYASQAEADWFARRVLREHIAPYIMGVHRRDGWVDSFTLDRLVEIDPSFGLQLLRRTRERGVRSDEAEQDPGRRGLIARALNALGRSKQAEALMAGSS